MKLNQLLIEPLPEELTQYADEREICHGKILDDCSKGDKDSLKKVLFLGDSHAAQLNEFADQVGKINGINFQIITASSCITIPNFDLERLPQWAQKPCAEQIDTSQKLLLQAEDIILAGKWDYQTQSSKFIEAIDTFFYQANLRKQHVIVLA